MIDRAVDEGLRHARNLLGMSRYAALHAESIVDAALEGLVRDGWQLVPPDADPRTETA